MTSHIIEIKLTKFPSGKYQYDLYGYINNHSKSKVLLSAVEFYYPNREAALIAAKKHSLWDCYTVDENVQIVDEEIKNP